MTLKKEVKKSTGTNKQQNPIQNKSGDDKKKNDCGCGCSVSKKK